MLSDDELRRIARRVLQTVIVDGWHEYDNTALENATAILREEFDSLAEKIRSQNWIQSDGELIADPFATVVHTTDY